MYRAYTLLFLFCFGISQLYGREITTLEKIRNPFSEVDAALNILTRARGFFAKNVALLKPTSPHRPMDCEEVLRAGSNKSGIYTIYPRSRVVDNKPLEVFCDMDTDGGGWTVLQRRGDFKRPKDYFNKDWKTYKNGFGDIDKEFWIGNDNIFALTNQRVYSVRFDLESLKGEKRYALYDYFWIDDEDHKYTLHIQDYSGDAGDSMTKSHNNMSFSTFDEDNDIGDGNCGLKYEAGWWYKSCYNALLNGLHERSPMEENESGVHWIAFTGKFESLHADEIKIRPKNFRKKDED